MADKFVNTAGNALYKAIDAVVEKHGTLRAAALVLKTDVGYLSCLRRGKKDNPNPKLLKRLGVRRVITFEAIKP